MIRLYFCLSLLLLLSAPRKTLAHGAHIEYQESSAITLQGKYADGSPMAQAQVLVYAPSDRANPWLKGTTNQDGSFSFVPDTTPENLGDWDVVVRQAGHGSITSIPVTAAKQTQLLSADVPYSASQKLAMAAAIGWGFVGTALFFNRSKSSS